MADERVARDEDQVDPNVSGMGGHGGKGPTAAATKPVAGAFGEALGRHGKGGVHTPDDEAQAADNVGAQGKTHSKKKD